MVVRTDQARDAALQTVSDASRQATEWSLGVGYEFENRPDGLPALNRTYYLRWSAQPKEMDVGRLFRALSERQVSMIAANSTDGLLSREDYTMLEDDRSAFPA